MARHSITLAFSIAVFGASLACAHAPADDQAPTQIVAYGDLNLTSPDGITALKRRVAWAVRSVCGDADNRDLQMQSLVQTCRRSAQAKSDPLVLAAIAHATQRLAGDSRTTVASR